MIELIDNKIKILLKYRDDKKVIGNSDLRSSICTIIEKSYFLEAIILSNKTFIEDSSNQFFVATVAVNRHFRDWGLEEIADIYNDLCEIAKPYLINGD